MNRHLKYENENRAEYKFAPKRTRFSHDNSANNESSNFTPLGDETLLYFNHALETLKQGISDEEKGIFARNVLEQTEGHELKLSCESASSHCIELLFNETNDLKAMIRFMKVFSENFEVSCGNCFASHITETLLYYAVKNMQSWSSDVDAAEKDAKHSETAENVVYIISWIHSLGEFCLKTLSVCLEDTYGCHVLKTLIHALGGFYIPDSHNQKKRAKIQKKDFKEEYLGPDCSLKQKENIILAAIPKFFVTVLKQITKAFKKLKDIKSYAIQPETSPVIQALLFVLKKRLPKRCKKIITVLSTSLFDEKTKEGIPKALLHKNCSYVVEKIFELTVEDQQKEMWETQIEPFLKTLVNHPIANFVVQRVFDIVDNKLLFESMCESIYKLFDVIYESSHYGIWLSIANACNRLKTQQAQYMTNLMQCFGCSEPEEKQLQLIPVLLALRKYDDLIEKREQSSSTSHMLITLQGSLLVQSILRFQKPLKAVRSILNMKPEELSFLACHMQGCHILLCFLSSINVGEKNKDKFVQVLKPSLSSLACDQNGSLTLSRMWVLYTMKQKSVIAEELLKSDHLLQQNRHGFGITKKFGLFHYKCRRDQWKEFQQNITKKRHSNE